MKHDDGRLLRRERKTPLLRVRCDDVASVLQDSEGTFVAERRVQRQVVTVAERTTLLQLGRDFVEQVVDRQHEEEW